MDSDFMVKLAWRLSANKQLKHSALFSYRTRYDAIEFSNCSLRSSVQFGNEMASYRAP